MRVPVMYGDMSRQAATVLNNNSSSTLPSPPLITYYISGLEYNQKWLQSPTFVDKMNVRQRQFNETTNSYETTQGQAFTIERLMPAPYILRVTVDIWTTNYNQKLEIIEQLSGIFNPAFEIQSSDSFVDWTSLSVVFQDGINYTSRTIPMGTNNPIDILTWKFYMPIWLTVPAKIKKLGVVEKIVASIFNGSTLDDMQDDDLLLGTRTKIAPYGYGVLLLNNKLQLLPANQPPIPSNSSLLVPENPYTDLFWSSFLNSYGAIRPGISQIWLENEHLSSPIVGTIVPDPLDDRFLIYDIDTDTLPQNTLDPINGIINPQDVGPNAGLPTPTIGDRYMIINNIQPNASWGNLTANKNDIIEFDGTEWFVAFDSLSTTDTQFVLNLTTSVQYRYSLNEIGWTKSYDGYYTEGNFSIVI